MNKRSMPPLLSICILFSIVCIVVIARGSLTTKDERSIPALASNLASLEDKELNESERVILTMLLSGMDLSDNQLYIEDTIHSTYFKYLKDYLSSSEVDLSTMQTYKVVDKIKAMNAIINIEKESDIHKMSLDGRGVAMHISEQIYALCGLKLEHNFQGNIVLITDTWDNSIYVNDDPIKQAGFQLDALVMTLVAMTTLLSICIIIAKKNQLFRKDGLYRGFDEKGYAQ